MYRQRRLLASAGIASLGLGYLTLTDSGRWYTSGVIRSTRTLAVGAAVVADYKFNYPDREDPDFESRRSAIHKRNGLRMLRLFEANGGVYLKTGQHFASMGQVLPKEIVQSLRPCQDQCPTVSLEEAQSNFMKDLGMPIQALYSEFEEKPFAAASLAQVHRATTMDGQKVAVKIQFPGLAERCSWDTTTVDLLSRVVMKIFPDFEFKWLVDEMKKNLPEELNFLHEARNCNRTGSLFASHQDVTTPRVLDHLSGRRVLTMEFIDGCRVDDLQRLQNYGFKPDQVAKLLTRCFSQQIFEFGWVHCDPHPGNLLVRPCPDDPKKPQLVLLDHGLYRHLEQDFRIEYCFLWRGLILGQRDVVEKCCQNLGVQNSWLLATMMTHRPWHLAPKNLEGEWTEEEKKEMFRAVHGMTAEMTQILASIPPQMLLLFKCNDLLRAVIRDLHVKHIVNPYLIMAQHCQTALDQHNMQAIHGTGATGKENSAWSRFRFHAMLFVWSLFNSARSWLPIGAG